MSATANPNFELQQTALKSLERINQILLALECLQVVGSGLVLGMAYFARPLHLWASMIYFFCVVFGHVVVFYVIQAIGRNVRDAHAVNPRGMLDWVVVATSRQAFRLLPFFAIHVAALVGLLASAMVYGIHGGQPAHHHYGAWCVAGIGIVSALRVALALRSNNSYLTSFVTAGGFTNDDISDELVEN